MDVIALLLSLAAIVVSIVVALSEHDLNLKINRINLAATYFDEIYKEHLVYKIPKARRYLRFGLNNKPKDTQYLIDELNDIRKESLYFCYVNPKFYNGLVDKLRKLEDYLIVSEDKTFLGDQQLNFFKQVHYYINEIYKHITAEYVGNNDIE